MNDTLIAGIPLKKANNIKPMSHQYFWFLEMPDGKGRMLGVETHILEQVNYKGRKVIGFIKKHPIETEVSYDTTFFERGTLLPLAYHANFPNEGYKVLINFYSDKIARKVIYKDSVRSFERLVADGYYNAPMDECLYGMPPLKNNYRVKFRKINPGERYEELNIRIIVKGSEQLGLPDGNILVCLVLEEFNNERSISALWYTKRNQEFIKRRFGSI